MNGVLYNIHCKTWTIAKQLMGCHHNATRVDMGGKFPTDALFTFRALPQYRSQSALDLRAKVARIVWNERQS